MRKEDMFMFDPKVEAHVGWHVNQATQKLREIAETGVQHGEFGGEEMQKTADAITGIHAKHILSLQDDLASVYKHKKLPFELSELVRKRYLAYLPPNLNIRGDETFKIYSKAGTLISVGYKRIVIGDYGAFVEIDRAIKENMQVKPGQEYRVNDPKYKDKVKYHWLTVKDDSDIKIYHQVKTVAYADYLPGMYYVSPYEVKTGILER